MNIDSKNNVNEKKRKRLFCTLLISSAVFLVLSSIILTPLYIYACSDVVYATTAIPEILEIVIDIVDVMAYAVCFSVIIYSIFKFSLKSSVRLILVYCAYVFLKYLANLVISSIVDGVFSPSDVIYVLIYLALDIILLALILTIAIAFMRRYYENRSVIEKANNTLEKKTPSVHEDLFAAKKFFSPKNPLQCAALVTGIILSAAKILSRIRYDIYIGAPTSLADTMWMIAYYASDILIAIIVYAISLYMFAHFEAKEQGDKGNA